MDGIEIWFKNKLGEDAYSIINQYSIDVAKTCNMCCSVVIENKSTSPICHGTSWAYSEHDGLFVQGVCRLPQYMHHVSNVYLLEDCEQGVFPSLLTPLYLSVYGKTYQNKQTVMDMKMWYKVILLPNGETFCICKECLFRRIKLKYSLKYLRMNALSRKRWRI